jgi:1-acyl-sn-glycerol-3-phosphate acyltransferase
VTNWKLVWREYRRELYEPPLIGPGLRDNLPLGVRKILHYLFTTFRYAGFYLIFKPIAWLLINGSCNFKVRGTENIPQEGSFLGTCNHLSNFDPLIGAYWLPRPTFTMVKSEYFKTPILGGIVTALGGFPVRRGEADRQAIRTALEVLKRGYIMCIFPEGTRSKTFRLQEGHPGAALIASNSNTLVLPGSIVGTENIMRRRKFGFLRRPQVELIIGKPYDLKEAAAEFAATHNLEFGGKRNRHNDLEFYSDIMLLKIAENLPSEYQGEFTPEGVVARFKARQSQQNATRYSAS